MSDSIKCPSCGAQSSNFINCEYCNSVIGKSSEEGSNTEDFVFDGLLNAFGNNLKLQKDGGGLVVTTMEIGNTGISIGQSNRISTETKPSFPGLTIQLFKSSFDVDGWSKVLKLGEAIMTNEFSGSAEDVEYLIDFGQDIDNAASVTSKIFLINEARSANIFISTEDLDGEVSTEYVYGEKENSQPLNKEVNSNVTKVVKQKTKAQKWSESGSFSANIVGLLILGAGAYLFYKVFSWVFL